MGDEKPRASNTKKVIPAYELFAGDNPGIVITQVQLRETNYEEWSRAMRGALKARRKFGFVDGTIVQPKPNSIDFDEWDAVNHLVVSRIRNTIESDLRSTVSYIDDAKTLWDELKNRFSVANGVRIHQLKSDVANCKQNGSSITHNYGRLKRLWDEIYDLEAIPLCTCSGCKCKLSVTLTKKREEEKVHHFLMGLDESAYKTARSQILATDPLPDLNRVYQKALQKENVNAMGRGSEEKSDPVGFAIRGPRAQGRLKIVPHLHLHLL